MTPSQPFGLCLFLKDSRDLHVLKDLLHLVKLSAPSGPRQFFYVEASHSVLPTLSLEDNLRTVVNFESWREFELTLKPEWQPLVKLLKRPALKSTEAEPWERFLIGLMKGLLTETDFLLLDLREEDLPPFLIAGVKDALVKVGASRRVIMASQKPFLWLDCAHSLVRRQGYEFESLPLDEELLRKHWSAA